MRGTRAKAIRMEATSLYGAARTMMKDCPPQKTIYMRLKKMHTGRMPLSRDLLYRPVRPMRIYQFNWSRRKAWLQEFFNNLKEKRR